MPARVFRHLAAGYRAEPPRSAEPWRLAVDTHRQVVAVMAHRRLTGTPVLDLDFSTCSARRTA